MLSEKGIATLTSSVYLCNHYTNLTVVCLLVSEVRAGDHRKPFDPK